MLHICTKLYLSFKLKAKRVYLLSISAVTRAIAKVGHFYLEFIL